MNDTNFRILVSLEPVKTRLKRAIILLYCHHWLSAKSVVWLFNRINLKHV